MRRLKYISIPEIKKAETTSIKTKKTKQIIQLNQADSLQLISINGVGPFYAKQIVKYRKELGGFRNYAQITEIWGLENSEIQKLKQ